MTKDERVSMFNQAQARDMEEKQKAIKGQAARGAVDDGEMQTISVRLPKVIHAAAMQERLVTGKSVNAIIVEVMEKRYPKDSRYWKMAMLSLEMDELE